MPPDDVPRQRRQLWRNLRFLVNKSLFINVWVVSASVCVCVCVGFFFPHLLALFIKPNGLRLPFYVYVALAAKLQWESRAKKNIVRQAHKALAGEPSQEIHLLSLTLVSKLVAIAFPLIHHPTPPSPEEPGCRATQTASP